MSATVQKLLDAFEALPKADQHQAAIEIFRRISPVTEGDVPEAGLVEAADELFRALDAEEADHAKR